MIGAKLRKRSDFFDSKAVLRAIGRARAKALNDFGRLVRKAAQASLKYAPGPAPAGSPPHAHKSRKITKKSKSKGTVRTRSVSFLREFLYYKFDKSTKSVVTGPERLNSTVDPDALPALEYGGPSTAKRDGKIVDIQVRPHPFMGPAFEATKPELPRLWKDSVKN